MTLHFTKLQATGNDFVLIDLRGDDTTTFPFDEYARRLCDRHFSVGADGLLVLCDSQSGDFRMRMFNPDGTEDMCGNGTRCATRYVMESAGRSEAVYRMETIAGVREVRGQIRDNVARISVNMGKPIFAPETLPAEIDINPILDYPLEVSDEVFHITSLSTGTPHTCIFLEGPVDETTFQSISPQIENHERFPQRTSVLWVYQKDRDHLFVRIWERAVGETLACGTGACATLVAANMKRLVGRKGKVESRGGILEIEWLPDDSLLKTGPAEIVFRGKGEYGIANVE